MPAANNPIVTVLGAGSWGKTLAALLCANGLNVRLWGRTLPSQQDLTSFLKDGITIAEPQKAGVELALNLDRAVQNADWIVVALPTVAVAQMAAQIGPLISGKSYLISGTKGLNAQNAQRPSVMWQKAGVDLHHFVALSGPNLAKEMRAGVPTSSVAASADEELAAQAAELLTSPRLRIYRNTDLIGVELGGALKNVIAIAAGICDGLGFGDNAKAALITRGWAEMTKLALSLGAKPQTLYGLSGLGDLIATCASQQSRNHTMGELLGQGVSLDEARQQIGQVAEGVFTTQAALLLAKEQNVELPISEQLHRVIFEGYSAHQAVQNLMSRPQKHELV